MTAPLFVFWVLAFATAASGAMVVAARNPVHSVLWLILAFFNTAGLFVLIGAEFLAMVLVVVYVGAVAVLFMFVVMMLDLEVVRAREGFWRYAPVGALVGVVFLIELGLVLTAWSVDQGARIDKPTPDAFGDGAVSNTEALGRLLYTDYVFAFQTAGLILLVAIVGAIALTLRERPNVRRQDISAQVNRKASETVRLANPPARSGV